MNQSFIDTLYLFSCGARGLKPSIKHQIDLDAIYLIAKKQGVWEIVFLALNNLYKGNSQVMPKEVFNKYYVDFIRRCGKQYIRYEFVHKLIKMLNDEQIECCILKGESVARYYNAPITRISSDVDILIEPKELKKCLRLMKEKGFKVGDIIYESHHVECRHPDVGLVEIHKRMYTKPTNDISFNNVVKYNDKRLKLVAEDGTEYMTLGNTDNFLFLLLHFIKHFLSDGASVRQIMDVLLFVENNYNVIDWERVKKVLAELNFSKIFECIIAIGINYFHFPETLFVVDKVDSELIDKILNDMYIGGMFGLQDESRRNFYELYLSKRYKMMKGKHYNLYRIAFKLSRLFPSRRYMEKKFLYVKKSAFLLPVAWVHRIIKEFSSENGRQIENIEMKKKQEERIELLHELNMI